MTRLCDSPLGTPFAVLGDRATTPIPKGRSLFVGEKVRQTRIVRIEGTCCLRKQLRERE
jgi:hypothetical protein